MQKVAEDNGLKFDYWTSEVQGNLGNKITEISNSDTVEYVSAQVKYNADGNLHWVGVEEVETRADGKTYIKIEPSSVHDTEKVNRLLVLFLVQKIASSLFCTRNKTNNRSKRN